MVHAVAGLDKEHIVGFLTCKGEHLLEVKYFGIGKFRHTRVDQSLALVGDAGKYILSRGFGLFLTLGARCRNSGRGCRCLIIVGVNEHHAHIIQGFVV